MSGLVRRRRRPARRVDAELFQRARHDDGVLELPRGLGVPGHEPALVAVDHEFEAIPDAFADGRHYGDVVTPVRAAEADLHGLEAACDVVLGEVHGLFDGAQ